MSEALDRLTPREREVLELIVGGLTNRQIGERLVISVETVQTHVKHILEKLAVRSRWQAADAVRKSPNQGYSQTG